jgi:Resolvase, N terminal domain
VRDFIGRGRAVKAAASKSQRCAIYTRVSTDQGLEQEFNSLHAQREAAQAYIKSQAHEGWRLIRDHYDDGGFSGGSMERPALQKLLADISKRQIDIVVVYKVDRLTRSLTDFAKLVTSASLNESDRTPPAGLCGKPLDLDEANPLPPSSASDRERVERLVDRIIVRSRSVEIHLCAGLAAPSDLITVPWSPTTFRRKREVIQPAGGPSLAARPIRLEARTKLLVAIVKGRRWLDEIASSVAPDIESIAARERLSARSARMVLSLAFLAPDIVEAAANGTLPRGFGVSRLTDLPVSWNEQRLTLGLAMSS